MTIAHGECPDCAEPIAAPGCGLWHRLRAAALVGVSVVAVSAQATPICRWVDDSGRTRLADVVPERYAASARCTDSRQFEISSDRSQQADERARQLRQRADTSKPLKGDAAPSPSSAAASGPAAPVAGKRPARSVDRSTDCATWRRLYDESSACFAPYRTVGGTKAEAFRQCRVIPSPDPKCGSASN